MEHEYKNMRRHMEATLAEMNRHLDNAETKKDPQRHSMVTATARHAVNALKDLDEMENRRMYSGTNIGYSAESRGNADNAMRSAIDAIGKLLPHISEDYEAAFEAAYADAYNDGMEARRYGGKGGRFVRSDADNNYDARSTSDNERYTHEAIASAAANAAAATARHMANDRGDIYPHTPVMPHESRGNARGDTSYDARSDARSEGTADRAGPVMNR